MVIVTLGTWLKPQEERSPQASTDAALEAVAEASPTPTSEGVDPLGSPSGRRHVDTVDGVPFSYSEQAGWERHGISINLSTVGPQGAEAIIFWATFPESDRAVACTHLLRAPAGPSTADLAAAVATAPGTELVTGPSDVTVGGRPAKRVVLTVREDLGCDPGFFYAWDEEEGGAFWGRHTVADRVSVWIVDVAGTRLFIGALTTTHADPSLEQEIEQIVESIRFDPERVGFVGLPPEDATPSTPHDGELVLSFYGSADGIPRSKVFVYADGRLIWQQEADFPYGANQRSTGFLEQHLTPEGVELMQSEVASSRLFGDILDLARHGPLDATPVSALERIVPRLTAPASWLPPSAWEDPEIRAYVPSRYEVCHEGRTRESDRVLTQLPPSAGSLRDRDGCSAVTTAEARAIVERLDEAGLERIESEGSDRLEYRLDLGGFSIWFEPILPHGEVAPQIG